MRKYFLSSIFIIFLSIGVFAQSETLTNQQIAEMSKAGLSSEIILSKIAKSDSKFDVSTDALIALKKSGVAEEVISAMLEKSGSGEKDSPNANAAINYSESQPAIEQTSPVATVKTPKEAIQTAKTISFVKSSVQPSRQALEKELLKRPDWKSLNLTIERYRDNADLYVEIGYVSLSWITHRYVYRVYDRRSGAVLAAGETTSWGSLAENLARHISKNLNDIVAAK